MKFLFSPRDSGGSLRSEGAWWVGLDWEEEEKERREEEKGEVSFPEGEEEKGEGWKVERSVAEEEEGIPRRPMREAPLPSESSPPGPSNPLRRQLDGLLRLVLLSDCDEDPRKGEEKTSLFEEAS